MLERIPYKIDKIILALIFGLVIYIPLFVGLVEKDKISSGTEKRNLAILPSSPESIKDFIEYPATFNQYYSDHFGLREKLTKAYFRLTHKLGAKSSIDDVTIGQGGWLFLGSIKPGYMGHGDPIGDAINVNLFSEKELMDFAASITTIRNWLSNRGIEYIYVIAPNKHTIYFDKLPKYISKKNSESATDQLVKYLQENTDIIVIDLRQALLEEKKKHPVYFKSDTHWNHYGANVAQFEITRKIKTLFPEQISPSLLNDKQFEILPKMNGDLAGFAKITNIIEDDPQPVFEKECQPVNETPNAKETGPFTMTCDTQALNAVIFRDSFFTALQPYFSRKFHRSTYIWKRMNYDSLVKYVELEKPDIVIDEVVERALPYMPLSAHFENQLLPEIQSKQPTE